MKKNFNIKKYREIRREKHTSTKQIQNTVKEEEMKNLIKVLVANTTSIKRLKNEMANTEKR